MKLTLAIALIFAACLTDYEVEAVDGESPAKPPQGAQGAERGSEDQVREESRLKYRPVNGTEELTAGVNAFLEGDVGEGIDQLTTGLLKTADSLIDTVGAAAGSIVTTITGLVFAVLGIIISLSLTVLGVVGPFLSIAGMPLSLAAGMLPMLLGLVNSLLPMLLGLVDSVLGGLGKK